VTQIKKGAHWSEVGSGALSGIGQRQWRETREWMAGGELQRE
jgi:hypothetical protein